MVTLWQVLVKLYNFAGPILILAYPLYASVTAIESPSKEDETQWLTYWVLYSLIQLVEIALDRVLVWIPIWYTFKLVAVAWLVLPQFHGAAFVYDNYVKKYLPGIIPNAGGQNQKGGSKRQGIDQMSPKAQAAVSDFIAEHGSAAFDRVIEAAIQAPKRERN